MTIRLSKDSSALESLRQSASPILGKASAISSGLMEAEMERANECCHRRIFTVNRKIQPIFDAFSVRHTETISKVTRHQARFLPSGPRTRWHLSSTS